MNAFFLPLLVASVVIEGLATTIPLVWVVLLVQYSLRRKPLFIHALIAGLALSLFSVSSLYVYSLVLIMLLLTVVLYERKFEISTLPFVALASFFGSIVFLFIGGYNEVLLQAFVSALLASFLFHVLQGKTVSSMTE